MYPRSEYEMTQADLDAIYNACRPTPVMMIGGSTGSSPQENANRAWQALGQKMGFDHMTVRPSPGKGERFFTAIPSETAEQRDARITRETEGQRLQRIATLRREIAQRQGEINSLLPDDERPSAIAEHIATEGLPK